MSVTGEADELVQSPRNNTGWAPDHPPCRGSELRAVLTASFQRYEVPDRSPVRSKCLECLKDVENRPDSSHDSTKRADMGNTMHTLFTVIRKCFDDKSTIQTKNMVACAEPIIALNEQDAANRTESVADMTPNFRKAVASGRHPDYNRINELMYGCFKHLITPGEEGNPKFDDVTAVNGTKYSVSKKEVDSDQLVL
jgi:hypothetical protein